MYIGGKSHQLFVFRRRFAEKGDANYNSIGNISIPKDDSIDGYDLYILVDNWLEGTEP